MAVTMTVSLVAVRMPNHSLNYPTCFFYLLFITNIFNFLQTNFIRAFLQSSYTVGKDLSGSITLDAHVVRKLLEIKKTAKVSHAQTNKGITLSIRDLK